MNTVAAVANFLYYAKSNFVIEYLLIHAYQLNMHIDFRDNKNNWCSTNVVTIDFMTHFT